VLCSLSYHFLRRNDLFIKPRLSLDSPTLSATFRPYLGQNGQPSIFLIFQRLSFNYEYIWKFGKWFLYGYATYRFYFESLAVRDAKDQFWWITLSYRVLLRDILATKSRIIFDSKEYLKCINCTWTIKLVAVKWTHIRFKPSSRKLQLCSVQHMMLTWHIRTNNGYNAINHWYMSYWCLWSTFFYLGDYSIIYFLRLTSQLLKDSYNHVFTLYLGHYINFYETSLSVQQSLFCTCLRAISTNFFPIMLLSLRLI